MNICLTRIAALLLLLSPVVATADPIVFENKYEDGVAVPAAAWCSGCGSYWRVWDNFTLTEETEITQIDARVAFGGSPSIQYSIWTPDHATVLYAEEIAVEDLLVSQLVADSTQSDLFASIPSLRLAAGEYALSIWDMGYSGSMFAWYATGWANRGTAYQSFYFDGTGILGGGSNMEMAFRVHGITAPAAVTATLGRTVVATVPEPGTLALLGLGFFGMALAGRRIAG